MKETTPSKRQGRGTGPYHRHFATPEAEYIGQHSWESLMLAAHDVREFAKGRSSAAVHRLCYLIECLAEYADTVESRILPGITSSAFDPWAIRPAISEIRASLEARVREAPRGLALPLAWKEGNIVESYCRARAITAAMRAERLGRNGGSCYLQDMRSFLSIGRAIRGTCGTGRQSRDAVGWNVRDSAHFQAWRTLYTVGTLRGIGFIG